MTDATKPNISCDEELPGTWEQADLIGGETDMDNTQNSVLRGFWFHRHHSGAGTPPSTIGSISLRTRSTVGGRTTGSGRLVVTSTGDEPSSSICRWDTALSP